MNATDPRAQALDEMPSPKTDPQARPLGRMAPTAWTQPSPSRAVQARKASRPTAKAGKSPRRAPVAWRKAWKVA